MSASAQRVRPSRHGRRSRKAVAQKMPRQMAGPHRSKVRRCPCALHPCSENMCCLDIPLCGYCCTLMHTFAAPLPPPDVCHKFSMQ